MEYARPLGHHQKTKLMYHGYRKSRAKGIDNLFNNIIAESFSNLEKRRDIQA
jgi:hypothetical protein